MKKGSKKKSRWIDKIICAVALMLLGFAIVESLITPDKTMEQMNQAYDKRYAVNSERSGR